MVTDKKVNPFPADHYCLSTCPHTGAPQFKDTLDDHTSTGHVVVRLNGRPVASTRVVNGKVESLEAESYGWVPDMREQLAPHLKDPNSIAEPSRLVACRSVRGSNVVPFLYLHVQQWYMDNEIEGIVGFVNNEARSLTQHYTRWCKMHWMSDSNTSIPADEFLPGRKLQWCVIPVGEKGSAVRDQFLITNAAPALAAWGVTKEPKIEQGKLHVPAPLLVGKPEGLVGVRRQAAA